MKIPWLEISPDQETRDTLEAINVKINKLLFMENKLMATLDETLAKVNEDATIDDSLITLFNGIKAQLDAVLAGGLTPEAQAKVDAIFNSLQANIAKVSEVVTANTPAA